MIQLVSHECWSELAAQYYVSTTFNKRVNVKGETKETNQCFFLFLFRNPNEVHRQESVLPISRERNKYKSILWDEYDTLYQKYLEIGK